MGGKILGLAPFGVLCVLSWELHAQAGLADRCPQPIARIVSAQGTIELKEASANVWRLAKIDALVCPGDSIHVGERSRGAILLLAAETVLRIDENTTLQVLEPRQDYRSLLDLLNGVVHFLSRAPRSLEVKTPFVNAAVEGTEFLIRVETNHTFISVFEGRVAARNDSGSLSLTSNQSALIRAGEAPELRIVVRPRDAVRWALYYQPVLAGLFDPTSIDPRQDLTPALREVLRILGRGDLKAAFDRLDRIPEPERGERFYVYRAALLLSVGRVDEARSDLDRALALAPESGEVYALRAVIAIAGNDRQQALSDGREAVARSPRSSAARIALSYALQANFELAAARDTLLQAVEQRPEDSLAWARLAELWLSLGYLDKALEAAGRAASLAPNLGRTNTVLGFAALAQIKISKAKAAFERAIALESADPMPRLGLGLAKIREGELPEGRRQIEIAAALDPNNALLRSYLGKAYFDEKRGPHDADQFALAKKLDPNDPTPWLYDAIRKQTENRPVEALRDLQKSIELNDNRAVYRSRLLLDEDLAARGARLGSIYRDLGFEQLALVEGWKSVNIDPSNHSAHRILADTYAVLPRHEIARDSELLQSQLLQPININPVQPRLADNGLSFLEDTGPADVGFNEFSRLFAADQLRLHADGIVGSKDTVVDNAIHSGIYRNVSWSLGQFHFETDGFRDNNGLNQNFYNAFAQVNLSHRTSVQVELRKTDENAGFRRLLFDRDNFLSGFRREFDTESVRVGIRHNFQPNSTLIGSFVFRNLKDFQDTGTGLLVTINDDTNFFELRHLYQWGWGNLTGGVGYSNTDRLETIKFGPFPPTDTESEVIYKNAYVYSTINYLKGVSLSLGLSADDYESPVIERQQLNPKFGLTWILSPTTVFRAAAFKGLKRDLVSSQTIEPTQVAGFNQFFDDINGTKSWRYGIAIDQAISLDRKYPGPDMYAGAELSKRDLAVPTVFLFPTRTVDLDEEEIFGRAYLYWTPMDRLALRAEYQFVRLVRAADASNEDSLARSTTHKVPVELRFFHPSGLFARARATYINQRGRFADSTNTVFSGSDHFWTVDAALGYRFWNRRGLATLEVRNLLNERANFQDIDPKNTLVAPERLILFRVTISF